MRQTNQRQLLPPPLLDWGMVGKNEYGNPVNFSFSSSSTSLRMTRSSSGSSGESRGNTSLIPRVWILDTDRISTGIGCPGVMTILSHELVV
jgi:hypothetical protein